MTSSDLGAIREAAAAVLATISGLNVSPRFPKVINTPAAVVTRRETTYDTAFDIAADYTLAIKLFLSFADLNGSQDLLDEYTAPAGPRSIRAAFAANPRMGGVVDWCRVSVAEDERVTNYAGIDYLTVDLVLEVG